jgi:hypothetical protein
VAFNRLGESIAIRAREWQVPEGQGRESHRLLERSRELRLSRAKAEAPFSSCPAFQPEKTNRSCLDANCRGEVSCAEPLWSATIQHRFFPETGARLFGARNSLRACPRSPYRLSLCWARGEYGHAPGNGLRLHALPSRSSFASELGRRGGRHICRLRRAQSIA